MENKGLRSEAIGESTFVEIPMTPMTRKDGGVDSSSLMPMRQDITETTEMIQRPVQHPAERPMQQYTDAATKMRTGAENIEMVIQTGDVNLLIYEGIQEATLRTVMKVVMCHA